MDSDAGGQGHWEGKSTAESRNSTENMKKEKGGSSDRATCIVEGIK